MKETVSGFFLNTVYISTLEILFYLLTYISVFPQQPISISSQQHSNRIRSVFTQQFACNFRFVFVDENNTSVRGTCSLPLSRWRYAEWNGAYDWASPLIWFRLFRLRPRGIVMKLNPASLNADCVTVAHTVTRLSNPVTNSRLNALFEPDGI